MLRYVDEQVAAERPDVRLPVAVVPATALAAVLWDAMLVADGTPLLAGPVDALGTYLQFYAWQAALAFVAAAYFCTCLHGLAWGAGGEGPYWRSALLTTWGFAPWLAVEALAVVVAGLHVLVGFPDVVAGVPLNWFAGSLLVLARVAALGVAAVVWHRGVVAVHGLGAVRAAVVVAVPVLPVVATVVALNGAPLWKMLGAYGL